MPVFYKEYWLSGYGNRFTVTYYESLATAGNISAQSYSQKS